MPHRKVSELIADQELVTAPPDTTVRDAAGTMAAKGISALLVVADGELQGIFTGRDLVKRVVARDRDPNDTSLAEVMSPQPICVNADETGFAAMRAMIDAGIRHIVVIDGENVAGVVSMRDFGGGEIQLFQREMEFEKQVWEEI